MAGWLVRGLWVLVSVALVVGAGVSPARADDLDDTAAAGAEAAVRPDWVSASVTARSSGSRVEVLSERSETTRVFVEPDGGVVEETAFAPVRFRDESGVDGWSEIDTRLVASSSGVRPVSMPLDVVVGGDDLVVFDAEGAGEVAFGLDGVVLPEPVLDESTAVYRDVWPGVDVSVEVRSAGFEVLWVVNTPQAAKLLADRFGAGGDVVLPATLRSKNAGAATSDGGIEFKRVGKKVGGFGAAVAWDSAAQLPGERGAQTRVGVALGKQHGQSRGVGVSTPKSWLMSKDRVFPVVIDPTYAVASGGPVFDAFVQEGYSSDQSGAGELKLGDNGAGQVARSFLNFNASLFKGRQIVSANLSLYESWSWSCNARSFSAYDSGVASSSTRWTSQPSIGSKRASVSAAKGYTSSCPAGRVTLDMTAQAKAWSSTTASTVGMMLRADSESDSTYWKRFHSSEGSSKPVLTVTYNRTPGAPAAPTITGAVTVGSTRFVGAARPKLQVTVSDADGDTLKTQFARFTSSSSTTSPTTVCEQASTASGGTASCTPSSDLPGNQKMWIRARTWDSRVWSSWGSATEVTSSWATPLSPTISCPSASGSWSEDVKPAESCTVTARFDSTQATSAPTQAQYRVNGGAWQTVNFTQITANKQVASVSLGGKAGAHRLEAFVKSPTGKQSSTASYSFGYGAPTLVAPGTTVTTHGTVAVSAAGAPQGGAASLTGAVQWRVKGTPSWQDTAATVTGTASESTLVGSFDTAAVLAADPSLPTRTSVVFEVRARFVYGSTSVYTEAREVVRVPHAFGSGFPVTDVTGGQVALWTGELQMTATDAELATPSGGLSISRTHSTFAGEPSPAGGIFGPGWVASLDGGPLGVSDMELVDNTRVDGTLVLVDAAGSVLPFASDSDSVRTGATIPAGDYVPVGPDSEASDLTLTVTGTGTGTVVTARDLDGIETTFTTKSAATATTDAVFVTGEVTDTETSETTRYVYDAAGRVAAIIAPAPDQVTAVCTPGTLVDGCRLLRLTYATSTGAGDFTGQLKQVTAQVNQETHQLASFTYDSRGRLVAQTDTVTGVTTGYGWDGASNRLASITPPGEAPVVFSYTSGKLAGVSRQVPTEAGGGTAQLAAIRYQIPLSGVAGLDLTQFDTYDLPRHASTGFAVFGTDAPIGSGIPAAGDEAWRRADLWLTDDQGYLIHEARYGAGAWQLTATIYDESDNITQAWDTRATAAIRDGDTTDIATAATTTVYNQDPILAADGTTVLVPARTRVTDVYTPAAMTFTTGADESELLRRHVATVYDQGAPEPGLSLPTTVTVTAERPDGDVVETLSTTFTGYDKLDSADAKSGWDLRQATSVTLDMNNNHTADAADIRKETRYDQRGRIIEQRQPGAAAGDPGTRRTVYWTAGANPDDPACGGQPAWAGYVCSEGPASQPAGVTVPVSYTSGYQWHGAATTSRDVSGSVTRTTTTGFDAKARPVTTATTVAGLAGSAPLPQVTTSYDSIGRVTGTTSTAGTTAVTYDSWGRQLTYTITAPGGTAETTTSTFNALGDLATVTTPKSVTTYSYDGTDANGNLEYRGLPTAVSVTAGGQSWTAQAAYDPHGDVTVESLPGGIRRDTIRDLAGELISMAYSGPVTDPDTGDTHTAPWIAWSINTDAAGRIVGEWNPDGAAFDDQLAGATAVKADLTYLYDKAGRLTQVVDRTDTVCTLRGYTFDKRGNRTNQTSGTSTDGTCPTTPDSTLTRAYDAYDRPVTAADGHSAYLYDELGRQTLIPSADTPNGGDITIGYYDDDTAKTVTQDGVTLDYVLDVAGRRTQQTTADSGGNATTVVTNHYVDDSDNPGWITSLDSGGPATTVYADLIGSDLGLSLISDDTGPRGELALTTPRGDVAATITLTNPTTPAAGLDTFTRYTEYGQPATDQPVSVTGAAANGYGWLGAKQRTTTTTGLLLMGARLYNPATGLFTSIDPVFGGNDTPYGYPNDPINKQDTTGEWSKARWASVAGVLAVVSGIAGWIPGAGQAVSTLTGYASAYAYHKAGMGRQAKTMAVATTIGLVTGGFGRLAGKAIARGITRSWAPRAAAVAKRAAPAPRQGFRFSFRPWAHGRRAPHSKAASRIITSYDYLGGRVGAAYSARRRR